MAIYCYVTSYPKTRQLKTAHIHCLAQFLSVWNLGVAQLGASGSGSLRSCRLLSLNWSWGTCCRPHLHSLTGCQLLVCHSYRAVYNIASPRVSNPTSGRQHPRQKPKISLFLS